jgi:hypothetical protein
MPSDYTYGEGVSGIAGRPVFDADGQQDWFFVLKSSEGTPTNIRFYYQSSQLQQLQSDLLQHVLEDGSNGVLQ